LHSLREDHKWLYVDYFCLNPVYGPHIFRRQRFRMSQSLFNHITDALSAKYRLFQQHPDVAGHLGSTPRQKVIVATRMLAYADSIDRVDTEVCMGASTINQSLKYFAWTIVATLAIST
ncbi:hypothetical protein BAE44_0022575, partial [Dichanthelium oligosanthes]